VLIPPVYLLTGIGPANTTYGGMHPVRFTVVSFRPRPLCPALYLPAHRSVANPSFRIFRRLFVVFPVSSCPRPMSHHYSCLFQLPFSRYLVENPLGLLVPDIIDVSPPPSQNCPVWLKLFLLPCFPPRAAACLHVDVTSPYRSTL